MAARIRSHPAPLSPGQRAGFVLVTFAAFMADTLATVPKHVLQPGNPDAMTWPLWGTVDASLPVFLPALALVYAALLLRRRAPLVALLGMCLLTLAFALGAVPTLPVGGVLICLYTVAAMVEPRRVSGVGLAVAILAQCTGLVLLERRPVDTALGFVLLGSISCIVWMFGRRDHLATLAAQGLAGQLAEHGEQAAAQERRRIARELHDIVAHSVSAMMMQAAGAKAVATGMRQDLPDPRLETVERALGTIENTGSQSMRELHRLLGVLRDGEADGDADGETGGESSSKPGVADIGPLVELTRQSGLVVEVHTAGPAVRLDPSVGLAAYRIVQESLTNAMKHGGRGAVVDIFQNWQPDRLQLQVRSRSGHEGTQPGSLSGGSGLPGLRERVELIGGTFESGWAGDDFVATAVLPLTPNRPPNGAAGPEGGPGPGMASRAADLHGRHGTRLDEARTSDDGTDLGRLESIRSEGFGLRLEPRRIP